MTATIPRRQDADNLAYIARAECGCIKLAVAERIAEKHAQDIGECIRLGMRVELITAAEVRAQPWTCDACREPAQETLLPDDHLTNTRDLLAAAELEEGR